MRLRNCLLRIVLNVLLELRLLLLGSLSWVVLLLVLVALNWGLRSNLVVIGRILISLCSSRRCLSKRVRKRRSPRLGSRLTL